jgi:hypothetical protein
MKILLSPVDTYLGRALFRFLSKDKKFRKHEIIGSLLNEAHPQFKPNSITRWVSVCFGASFLSFSFNHLILAAFLAFPTR